MYGKIGMKATKPLPKNEQTLAPQAFRG